MESTFMSLVNLILCCIFVFYITMLKSTVCLILLFCALVLPAAVAAHPVDEIDGVKTYDQKQTLFVGRNDVTLSIDLTFYALDKIRLWDSIDNNKDRKVSDSEKNIWMQKGQRSSWLMITGNRTDFTPISLSFPDYYDFFSSKPAEVRIEFISKTSISPPQTIEYHYKGKDRDLSEIKIMAKGRGDITVSKVKKVSAEVLSLNLKKGIQDTGHVLGAATTDRVSTFLNTYIKSENVPLHVQIYALIIAMLLGAIHALTPGHGKAITAGYLVGSRGTILHAIYLGIIITITHTASVFILGAGTLFLSAYVVPATVIKTLNLISGLLIVGFGLFLLFQRITAVVRNQLSTHEHLALKVDSLTWKHLLAFGITGGIVPCVDALAILLVAVALQKIVFGFIILIAFSIGLAFALTASGMVAVFAKKSVLKRYNNLHRIENYLGILSAIIVTVLGLLMLIKI